MSSRLTPDQVHSLQKILTLSLEIETSNFDLHKLSAENQKKIHLIEALLEPFKSSSLLELQKLGETPQHFSTDMSLRHFVNLMIPVERLLDRQLRDQDFLPADFVTTQDQFCQDYQRRPLYFILDNIRSAFNVGAIFRLADGVGASEVALCGYTPNSEQAQVKKTSMSADQFIPQRIFHHAELAIEYYLAQKIQVIALETTTKTESLYDQPLKGPTAFLLGNERFGLDYSLLSKVSEIRKIPMYGIKNSLNVGQAAAIAAFEWSRQNS